MTILNHLVWYKFLQMNYVCKYENAHECVSVCVMDTILLAQLRTVIGIAFSGSLSLRNVHTIIKIISVAITPQVAYQDIFLSTHEMMYRMEYRPIKRHKKLFRRNKMGQITLCQSRIVLSIRKYG